MKRILIPVDYHPTSEKVAEEGIKMAIRLDAKVCLLHVVNDIDYYNVTDYDLFGSHFEIGSELDFSDGDATKEISETFLKKLSQKFDYPLETKAFIGDAPQAILEFAENWGADLIVMGTSSRSFFERIFIGSVARKVIENTEFPVLLIPIKK